MTTWLRFALIGLGVRRRTISLVFLALSAITWTFFPQVRLASVAWSTDRYQSIMTSVMDRVMEPLLDRVHYPTPLNSPKSR